MNSLIDSIFMLELAIISKANKLLTWRHSMNFLFGKKPTVQAFAEILEDGRMIANQEMQKPKYNEYKGSEPVLEINVRVQPANEPPFEAKMKAGLTKSFLLKPGVRVQVKYEPIKKQQVILDDENQAILERNPQLIKK
jgi:hypothetical protein